MRKLIILATSGVTVILLGYAILGQALKPVPFTQPNISIPVQSKPMVILKDVGEPQYTHFGLTEQDFQLIAAANFTHITENFDLCADPADVKWYLDSAQQYNLKVIMMAGAGEAEWGYACDGEPYPLTQKPIWQKDLVTDWINQWKTHPAVFAWDISNEAGLNFPNGENNPEIAEGWGKNAISLAQLQQAAVDVKTADPAHSRLIRMSGYVFYENTQFFFEQKNPFAKDLAEYVMINAYSNTPEYDPSLITEIVSKSASAISSIDPQVQVVYSLGVWHEPPMWTKPPAENVQNDIRQLNSFPDIAYYRYGAQAGSEWYFPDPNRGDPQLWELISSSNRALIDKYHLDTVTP